MKAEWTNKDSLSCEETTKAILVLNNLQEYALLNEWVEDAPYYFKEKGVCPLKPMPKELEWCSANGDFDEQKFVEGWNACIDAIIGGTKGEK